MINTGIWVIFHIMFVIIFITLGIIIGLAMAIVSNDKVFAKYVDETAKKKVALLKEINRLRDKDDG